MNNGKVMHTEKQLLKHRSKKLVEKSLLSKTLYKHILYIGTSIYLTFHFKDQLNGVFYAP